MSESEVERIESADGKPNVEIMASDEGLFRFVEYSEITDDGYTFWTPTHESGLYGDAAPAEKEARAILPWLRDESSY